MMQSIEQPKQKCSLGCSECPEASFTRQSHNPMFCVSSMARHQQVSQSDVLRLINGEAPTKITIIEYNEARAQCHSTVSAARALSLRRDAGARIGCHRRGGSWLVWYSMCCHHEWAGLSGSLTGSRMDMVAVQGWRVCVVDGKAALTCSAGHLHSGGESKCVIFNQSHMVCC